jgi:large subunit ribosomal protein L5
MAGATQRSRLKSRYEQEIRPGLVERFGYSTPMQAPVIRKITLNMGVGDAKQDSKVLEAATEQLATIAGQRPSVRRARKSIAAFKLREGMPVGVSVTLRGERSYEFLDRLMSVAIPRIRDFRGMNPRSFDGRGNYSLGVREQIIFPEIDYDAIDQTRGLDITITTSAKTDLEAFALLQAFGFPFARPEAPAAAPAGAGRAAAAEAAAAAAAVEETAAAEDDAKAEAVAAEELAVDEVAEELVEELVAEELVEEVAEELVEELVAEELVLEEVAAELAEERAAEEPAAEEPAAEEPAAEEPAAEEPAAEEPAAEEPAADEPAAAAEEPAAEVSVESVTEPDADAEPTAQPSSSESTAERSADDSDPDAPAAEPAPDAHNDQE